MIELPRSSVLTAIHAARYPGGFALAAGFQDGLVYLARYLEEGVAVTSEALLPGPVAQVCLFAPDRAQPHLVSLAAACAVEMVAVYDNVVVHGLDSAAVLPESTDHDCVLALGLADLTWSGRQDLLVGTYGQTMLGYSCSAGADPTQPLTYGVLFRRLVTHPVYWFASSDITGDGLREIIVRTGAGLSIFQASQWLRCLWVVGIFLTSLLPRRHARSTILLKRPPNALDAAQHDGDGMRGEAYSYQ